MAKTKWISVKEAVVIITERSGRSITDRGVRDLCDKAKVRAHRRTVERGPVWRIDQATVEAYADQRKQQDQE